jgi:hypothetical protein
MKAWAASSNGHDAPDMFERHFTVRTLAELWSLSEDTIQRWFEDVQGVMKVGADGRRKRGGSGSLRIPESVARRIHRERCG